MAAAWQPGLGPRYRGAKDPCAAAWQASPCLSSERALGSQAERDLWLRHRPPAGTRSCRMHRWRPCASVPHAPAHTCMRTGATQHMMHSTSDIDQADLELPASLCLPWQAPGKQGWQGVTLQQAL